MIYMLCCQLNSMVQAASLHVSASNCSFPLTDLVSHVYVCNHRNFTQLFSMLQVHSGHYEIKVCDNGISQSTHVSYCHLWMACACCLFTFTL